jgi:hypothetical protein
MSGDDSADGPITFRHGQRKGAPREYGVEILIEPRVEGAVIVTGGYVHVFADGAGACLDACGRSPIVLDLSPAQLRALIVQCERALKGIA